MNRRLTTIGVVIAAVICAIIAGALIGGITRPRLQEVQGVSDESTPVATVAATAPVITSPAPDETETPPAVAPPRESPPTATAAPTRESASSATAAPTPSATPAPAPPTPAATSEAPAVVTYTVQPGDILNRIAQQFNTTAEAIIELNPGINPDSLRIGEVLQIPAP